MLHKDYTTKKEDEFMGERVQGHTLFRLSVFMVGLIIMSFGIVLLIVSDIGAAPWDVLHVGLNIRFGLTVGMWSIIVGIIILTISALLSKKVPQYGAFLNMTLVGVFIDLFMKLPFIQTPSHIISQYIMGIIGIIVIGIGMGIYISAQLGAGPRDSLMIALTSITGWKIQYVRLTMEIVVVIVGGLLGGPIHLGTILFGVLIGPIGGVTIPYFQNLVHSFIAKLDSKNNKYLKTSSFQ